MRVVHLGYTDGEGGAGRAATRLHAGLRSIGVDSAMLVGKKVTNDETVCSTARGWLHRWINRMRPRMDALPLMAYPRRRRGYYFSSQWVPERVASHPMIASADIINLHWIGGGFLHPESLPKLGKPLVWRLSDMWAFTGGCHHAGTCTRYQDRCGACPQLGCVKEEDLSRKIWERKHRNWTDLNLTVVSPSRWMAERARKSSLFSDRRIEIIPNGIDPAVFKPIDKALARKSLSLPAAGPLVMFGAVNATRDPNKGYAYLRDAMARLPSMMPGAKPHLLIVGSEDVGSWSPPMETRVMGTVKDDHRLALCYSAADVFVIPSAEETFPNTVLEALACGTPVAAFPRGGITDMMEHQRNGYLAAEFDANALAEGIAWIVSNPERWKKLSARAMEKVAQEFTVERQARRYKTLYEDILNHGVSIAS